MISMSSSNMGHIRSRTRSPVYCIFNFNFIRMVVLMICRSSSNMMLGQKVGHYIKLTETLVNTVEAVFGQNVYLYDI